LIIILILSFYFRIYFVKTIFNIVLVIIFKSVIIIIILLLFFCYIYIIFIISYLSCEVKKNIKNKKLKKYCIYKGYIGGGPYIYAFYIEGAGARGVGATLYSNIYSTGVNIESTM